MKDNTPNFTEGSLALQRRSWYWILWTFPSSKGTLRQSNWSEPALMTLRPLLDLGVISTTIRKSNGCSRIWKLERSSNSTSKSLLKMWCFMTIIPLCLLWKMQIKGLIKFTTKRLVIMKAIYFTNKRMKSIIWICILLRIKSKFL